VPDYLEFTAAKFTFRVAADRLVANSVKSEIVIEPQITVEQ